MLCPPLACTLGCPGTMGTGRRLPLVGNSIQACAALEAGDLWVTLESNMGPTVTAQDVPCM